MSRNWPDKKELEIVFKVEATVKTLKKESEKPSKVRALGVRTREAQNEA